MPVKHQGRTYTALLLSGTQMPTRMSLAAFEHVFNDFAKKQNAETALGSHPGHPREQASGDGGSRRSILPAHIHSCTARRFGRYLDIMLECGRARLAALESGNS